MSLSAFLLLLAGLTVISAALAWFALGKFKIPTDLAPPDRRGWLVLAVRHGLRADVFGPVARWRLEGRVNERPLRVRVVEVEGDRWTEARVLLPGAAPDLCVRSRARPGAAGVPLAHPLADQVLVAQGDTALLDEVCQDEDRLAAWLELLGPEDGAVVDQGWLVRAIDGADGDQVADLVDQLLAGSRRMIG